MDLNEKCKGCKTYELKKKKDIFTIACNGLPYIKSKECPCLKCIVKSMCNKSCLKFFEYVEFQNKASKNPEELKEN